MPFAVGHGLIAATIFNATQERPSFRKHGVTMLLCAGLALIPDADFILEWAFNLKGWHRGFTHSFVFGLILGCAGTLLAGARQTRAVLGIMLASVSHASLDALLASRKGPGVELLWPFSTMRFKWDGLNYFGFRFDPRFDPWSDIFFYLVKVSFFELIVAGLMFWTVLYLKRISHSTVRS